MSQNNITYDVALSFAGEDRTYVEKVAKCLEQNNVKVFYDDKEDLWGKNLYQHLDNVYQNNAKFIIVFISKHYTNKLWTKHELESAQAKAIQTDEEYILPVKFDDTLIPGIRITTGYVDARKVNPEELCKKILMKLKKDMIRIPKDNEEIELPTIKRKFTDIEKEKYIQESYSEIAQYFRRGLAKLEKTDNRVQTYFGDVTNKKFFVKVYLDGNLKSVCKIWIGYGFSSNGTIGYLESNSVLDNHEDNSYNDYASLEDNGLEMYFRISMISFLNNDYEIDRNKASARDLAIYFWKKFIKNLN